MSAVYIIQITCDKCGKALRKMMGEQTFSGLRVSEAFSADYYRKRTKELGWISPQPGQDICDECNV